MATLVRSPHNSDSVQRPSSDGMNPGAFSSPSNAKHYLNRADAGGHIGHMTGKGHVPLKLRRDDGDLVLQNRGKPPDLARDA